MDEMNPVFQLLKGLVDNANQQIHYKGSFYAVGDPDCPHGATMAYVRGQLREVDARVKEIKTISA